MTIRMLKQLLLKTNGEKNGKKPNSPQKRTLQTRNHLLSSCVGDTKMIEEAKVPLFTAITWALTAGFVYYNKKYRTFTKTNEA